MLGLILCTLRGGILITVDIWGMLDYDSLNRKYVRVYKVCKHERGIIIHMETVPQECFCFVLELLNEMNAVLGH